MIKLTISEINKLIEFLETEIDTLDRKRVNAINNTKSKEYTREKNLLIGIKEKLKTYK